MGNVWAAVGLDGVVARAGLVPLVLRGRWAASRSPDPVPELATLSWSDRLRARLSSRLDDLFLLSELVAGDYRLAEGLERSRTELEDALACARREGWLHSPASFHRTPLPPGRGLALQSVSGRDGEIQLVFESGFEPAGDLPGAERYLDALPNRVASSRLLVHPGPERPWVVCLPGFRMGHPAVDAVGFRTAWLHRTLGLNVAVLTMPFHGSRSCAARSGDGFVSGDVMRTLLAEAQAVWDARRLIAWLRSRGAPRIAILGLSLGGYTTGLVAALEPELDCAIAGIPVVDLFDLIERQAGAGIAAVAGRFGLSWASVRELGRLISPLALPAASSLRVLATPWRHPHMPARCGTTGASRESNGIRAGTSGLSSNPGCRAWCGRPSTSAVSSRQRRPPGERRPEGESPVSKAMPVPWPWLRARSGDITCGRPRAQPP